MKSSKGGASSLKKTDLLAMARGEKIAELVIKNAKIVNVFTKTIESGNLAIADGLVIGIGDYQGEVELDYKGFYLAPGFIDGHVHIESSMLIPSNYALSVMPRGTTSVVADCHEIANVCGTDGIDFMLEASEASPLDVYMMIPSCVPSTSHETSGATLLAEDIDKYVGHKQVLGLGEMMDYPGAINGDEQVLKKISAFSSLTIDGHAPSVTREELNAYVLAGVETDHECVEAAELIEKIKRGMYVHLREGSQTKNVIDLLKGVKPAYYDRILFCSDDLHPSDIETTGHIDKIINLAIKGGIEPEQAISMATINIANCYRLRKVGAIAPGYKADIVAFKNLQDIEVIDVFKAGKLVVKNKFPQFNPVNIDAKKVMNTVHINQGSIDLSFSLNSDQVNVIGLIRNNVTTKKLREKVILSGGYFLPKNNPDLLKLCVIERHKGTGNVGKGIVRGYGLKNGALAMTIAHDSHNLICLGDNDDDMLLAIDKIKEIGGGIVLASKGKISEYLALEVGGLMSLNSGEYVRGKLDSLEKKTRALGVKEEIEDPFLQLAFLSLAVIPELKVTDLGLFDVNTFTVIPIEAVDES